MVAVTSTPQRKDAPMPKTWTQAEVEAYHRRMQALRDEFAYLDDDYHGDPEPDAIALQDARDAMEQCDTYDPDDREPRWHQRENVWED